MGRVRNGRETCNTRGSGNPSGRAGGNGWGLVRALACAAIVGIAASTGCGGAIVHVRSDIGDLPARIDTIVVLPARLGFGKLADQRRAGRYMGDFLIEATAGHAVLPEELPGTDPELIPAGLTALGEDPARAVTFSITAARSNRIEASDLPGRGNGQAVRHYSDYTVRLDVRSAATSALVGSVETYASAYANAPERDARGRPLGLAQAAEEAVRAAMRRFTPRLVQPTRPRQFGTLVEIPRPRRGATSRGGAADRNGGGRDEPGPLVSSADRLHRLQVLYPEVPEADLGRLVGSGARLLVLDPGRLRAFGIEKGDLVRGAGSQELASRAALARALARGEVPFISIDRPSGHFLLARWSH